MMFFCGGINRFTLQKILNLCSSSLPTIFQATVNPKVLLGHRVFVGFGPGIYLFKSKKLSNSRWDDVGRFNFEVGYSENLRF